MARSARGVRRVSRQVEATPRYTVERPQGLVMLPGANAPRPMGIPIGEPGGLAAATSVGITTGPGTTLTMVPADLTQGPRADITEFTIVTLDSGAY